MHLERSAYEKEDIFSSIDEMKEKLKFKIKEYGVLIFLALVLLYALIYNFVYPNIHSYYVESEGGQWGYAVFYEFKTEFLRQAGCGTQYFICLMDEPPDTIRVIQGDYEGVLTPETAKIPLWQKLYVFKDFDT